VAGKSKKHMGPRETKLALEVTESVWGNGNQGNPRVWKPAENEHGKGVALSTNRGSPFGSLRTESGKKNLEKEKA